MKTLEQATADRKEAEYQADRFPTPAQRAEIEAAKKEERAAKRREAA